MRNFREFKIGEWESAEYRDRIGIRYYVRIPFVKEMYKTDYLKPYSFNNQHKATDGNKISQPEYEELIQRGEKVFTLISIWKPWMCRGGERNQIYAMVSHKKPFVDIENYLNLIPEEVQEFFREEL